MVPVDVCHVAQMMIQVFHGNPKIKSHLTHELTLFLKCVCHCFAITYLYYISSIQNLITKLMSTPPPPLEKKEINNILNSMTSKSLSSLCKEVCLPVTVKCKCRARAMGCGDTIITVGRPLHACAGP